MKTDEFDELQARIRALDNHALLRLVAVEKSDYRPEAVEIACAELRHRGLKELDAKEYWQQYPSERISADGFCETCRAQTTNESPGNTFTINLVFGNRLMGHLDRCAACGSILQTDWLWFVIPIIPLGRYRVIYLEKGLLSGRYVARKLRKLK